MVEGYVKGGRETAKIAGEIYGRLLCSRSLVVAISGMCQSSDIWEQQQYIRIFEQIICWECLLLLSSQSFIFPYRV
jgi:hypothetical protein